MKIHVLLFLCMCFALGISAQNMLPNASFEKFSYHIEYPEIDGDVSSTNYLLEYITVLNEPVDLGQFYAGTYDIDYPWGQTSYGQYCGVYDWQNPYKWIVQESSAEVCSFYGHLGVGILNQSLHNVWYATFNDNNIIKFHAADYYSTAAISGYTGGEWPFTYGSRPAIYPYGHNAQHGKDYVGMNVYSLIQTPLDDAHGNKLIPGKTYRFSCYMKPIQSLDFSSHICGAWYKNLSYSSEYFSWDQPAQLKLLLADNEIVYQESGTCPSCGDPAFQEKDCGIWGIDDLQDIFEYTVADIQPTTFNYGPNDWIPFTIYFQAPPSAADLNWLGIELQGNCSAYILVDNVSLVKLDGTPSCEHDLLIQNTLLEDWTQNKRSSQTWIKLGPAAKVPDGNFSKMYAEKFVQLNPGFVTEVGATFEAKITPCSALPVSLTPGVFDECDELEGRSSATADIPTEAIQPDITVYPVPANDILYVGFLGAFKNADVAVYDMYGKQVHAIPFSGERMEISVKEWTPGIYILNVIDRDGTLLKNQKIVVAH